MTTLSSPSPSTSSPAASLASAPYPYASAPDIIRAHQKDAYFQGLLTNQLTDLHRRLLGARSAHGWSTESRTLADLIYLCLTTLLGNRTLGEEYCGLVQVEAPSSSLSNPDQARRLPSIQRRAAYIAGSILLPYGLAKLLPALRARIRARLQRNLARAEARAHSHPSPLDAKSSPPKAKGRSPTQTWSYKLQTYLLTNLSTLTSPAPVHALSLALFYFSGSYYELAKRLTGLRYIFTSRALSSSAEAGEPGSAPAGDRAGYELLGVLLVVQMSVQTYLHIRSTLESLSPSLRSSRASAERPAGAAGLDVSLDEHAYSANNAILLTEMGTPGASAGQAARVDIAAVTHTPVAAAASSKHGAGGGGDGDGVRYDLADGGAMRWIKGAQQRKCTLCLEELKDPAATQCGHVFCWACIGDWVREKPECPLCRREAMVQHILPLRAL
ncbi:Pex12 amino terminal region-domain-containing protein [Hypoxylon argillaceum]|nr:Pex12 amino terminal region-domain-containing protein [Hypoxylon argillaceum]